MKLQPPTPEDIAYQLEHASDDRRVVLFVSTALMNAVATVAVVLRLVARRINRTKLLADDYNIFAALILSYGLFANGVVATKYGLARHAAAVGKAKVDRHFLTQYTFELVYLQCITVVKISILFFYRRLFDTHRFRKLSSGVGIVVLAYWLAFTFATIFQCTPVDRLWIRHLEGTCINTPVLFLAASVINIVTNILIVVLPLPIVWSLRVSRQQKLALTGLLLLGSLYVFV
ncbi:MAG: hypothetical protein M1815_003660 [Lichina confinis]|nr:MAG: hypothetical protein M1815_003660 [Lichina confinis]